MSREYAMILEKSWTPRRLYTRPSPDPYRRLKIPLFLCILTPCHESLGEMGQIAESFAAIRPQEGRCEAPRFAHASGYILAKSWASPSLIAGGNALFQAHSGALGRGL